MVKEVTRTVYQANNGREFPSRLAAEQEDLRMRVTQFLADRADPHSPFVENDVLETSADAIIKYWGQLRQIMDEADLLMKEAKGEASSITVDRAALATGLRDKTVAALCAGGLVQVTPTPGGDR